MKGLYILVTLLIGMGASGIAQVSEDAIVGYWLTTHKDAKVQIYRKTDGTYEGKIIWLKNPIEKDGSAKTDQKNPDVSLQGIPLIELVVLRDLRFEDGMWTNGTKYDYKTGKTYKTELRLEGDTLHLYSTAAWFHRHDQWLSVPSLP